MVVAQFASDGIVVDSSVDSTTGCCQRSLHRARNTSTRARLTANAARRGDVDRDHASRDRP